MQIVSMMNYKGGVGKTTLALNLAAELAFNHGQRILLVDLDPQASLTFSCISVGIWRNQLETASTIKHWYDAFIDQDSEILLSTLIHRPPALRNNRGSVDLIASHLGLIDVDLEIAAKLVGANPRQMTNNFIRVHSRLKRGLSETQIVDNYDFVMIDCPPNFGIITRTALVASDGYFIPTKPDYLSTLGLRQLNLHVDRLVTDYNWYLRDLPGGDTPITPEPLGIIINMVKPYDRHPIQDQLVYIDEVRNLRIHVLEQMPRENNRYYSRQTDDRVPLVLQDETEPMFVERRTDLQMLAREVGTILGIP